MFSDGPSEDVKISFSIVDGSFPIRDQSWKLLELLLSDLVWLFNALSACQIRSILSCWCFFTV